MQRQIFKFHCIGGENLFEKVSDFIICWKYPRRLCSERSLSATFTFLAIMKSLNFLAIFSKDPGVLRNMSLYWIKRTFLISISKLPFLTIHHGNFQTLLIELFKVKNSLSSKILNNIFEKRQILCDNLRLQTDFFALSVRASHYGLNFLSYFAGKVWDFLPQDIKNLQDLDKFKRKIRHWEQKNCHCKLCRVYLHNVDYIVHMHIVYKWCIRMLKHYDWHIF